LRRNLPSRFPSQALQAGGLKPALLLRSSFRYFSLSLQSSWHLSIALLVPHRSLSMYRCSLRDTPEIQATIQSSPTQEDAAKDGEVTQNFHRGVRNCLTGLSRLTQASKRDFPGFWPFRPQGCKGIPGILNHPPCNQPPHGQARGRRPRLRGGGPTKANPGLQEFSRD